MHLKNSRKKYYCQFILRKHHTWGAMPTQALV